MALPWGRKPSSPSDMFARGLHGGRAAALRNGWRIGGLEISHLSSHPGTGAASHFDGGRRLENAMSRNRTRRMHLAAYRQLYAAVCSLSNSLYEEALAVSTDDRDAAFAASCALVAHLEHERSPATHRGLLGRIDALPRSCAKSSRRAAAQAP